MFTFLWQPDPAKPARKRQADIRLGDIVKCVKPTGVLGVVTRLDETNGEVDVRPTHYDPITPRPRSSRGTKTVRVTLLEVVYRPLKPGE